MYSYRRGENVIRITTDMVDAFRRACQKWKVRIDPLAIRFTARDWSRKRLYWFLINKIIYLNIIISVFLIPIALEKLRFNTKFKQSNFFLLETPAKFRRVH
jgi:hypothetical protein